MKNLSLIIASFFLLTGTAVAQQTHFSQFYSSSVYLNPAMAGIEPESKITFNYRNQWPEISNSFITQNASYETNVEDINSGFGINLYSDRAGAGALTTTGISGVYAYEVKVNRNFFVRGGIKAGMLRKFVDWNKLEFEDMIDAQQGLVSASRQRQGESINSFDLSAGIMAYSDTYYGGIAVDHLNKAETGLVNNDGQTNLERRFTIHAGAKYRVAQNNDYAISPNILLSQEGDFNKINVGVYAEMKALMVGVWYANDETLIASLGFQGKRFRVGYSYDLTTSAYTGATMGSHEISYVQTFKPKKAKKRSYLTTPCPKF